MKKDKQKNDKLKVKRKRKTSNSELETQNSKLRKRAENKLKERTAKKQGVSFKDDQSVIHELQVHQIELEMQNEELRNAQIQLEESRKKYSDLYDFAPVGYFTFDKNGLIIEVNLTGTGQLGVERNLLIKKPFSRFIHKDDQDVFFLHRSKVFETKTLQSCEIRLKRKNSAEFYAQLQSSAAEDSESNITFCFTTVIDISKQREIEQKLIESEKKFRNLVSNSLVGIFTTTLKGEILYVNDAMVKMFEYKDLEEATSRSTMSRYRNPQDRDAFIEALRKTCKVDSYELEFLTRKGKPINVLASATLEGDTLSGMVIDITKRKQAEEERMRLHEELKKTNAELDRSNKELDIYSYTISNDLRAPLRSIEGFAQAILEDYTDKLDETGRDYLHRVTSACRRMSQLIDALLAMARLSRVEIEENTVDLSSIAQIIAYELKKREPERRVEFIIAEKVKVKGDINLLRIVLENLFDNAWKFTGKHPTARIEFGVIDCGTTQLRNAECRMRNDKSETGNSEIVNPKSEMVYFIRDDGEGFDMNFVDKLFSPFRRFHGEAEFPGIGIGLAIVHKIITKHGGKIWEESAPEKGATFYFTLG